MRVSATIVGLVGAVAGTATAVTGYQHLAAVDEITPAASPALPAVGRPLPAAPPRIRVRLADCEPPARLMHAACVTEVTRTVVVHDLVPPQPASPPALVPAAQAAPAAPRAVRPAGTRHRAEAPREDRETGHALNHESEDQSVPEPGDD